MSTPKAKVICWTIRGQPQVGLRRLIPTTASINSLAGPFGPGRQCCELALRLARLRRSRWPGGLRSRSAAPWQSQDYQAKAALFVTRTQTVEEAMAKGERRA